MKNWIRWWGLGVFLAIALLWWLLIDVVIKFAIETVATEINGAKVELASVDFRLLPTQLTLHQLQITNPSLPMENVFESSKIDLELDSYRLLRRQFIVEQMALNGLQMNTARTSSGAINGRLLSKKGLFNSDKLDIADTIPGLSLPDTDALLAEEKQHLQQQVDEMSNDLKALESQWQTRIDELPDDEKIAAYKQRWEILKEKGWAEKLQGIRQLQKDIGKDLSLISSLDKQLKKDVLTVQQHIQNAKQLPAEEADRLLAKVGFSGNTKAITEAILSGQLKQWLQQGMSIVAGLSGGMISNEPPAPARGEGQWLHFTEAQPMPDTLIRNADINGQLKLAGQAIDFQGNAQDFSHQPQRWHKPAQFTLNGTAKTGGEFYAEGLIDHRAAANDDIVFSVKNLSIEQLTLADNKTLSLDMLAGTANIEGEFSLQGNNINLQTSSQFKQVNLQADSRSSSKANDIIVEALSSTNDFTLAVGLSGTATNPQFSFNSDMDKLLGKALNNEIKKQSAGLKDQLQKKIAAQLAPQLQQINQQGESFSDLEGLLSGKKKDIEAISKGLL